MRYNTVTASSISDAVELFFKRGWTDGLPVVPPTQADVDRMLEAGRIDGSSRIVQLSQRGTNLFAWQAATCAVMAGCLPEYFPVVLATWEAMADKRFNVHSVLSSTGGAAVAGVVSGPYAEQIGMNARANVLGPGNRANATIGRAVRLAAMVALDAAPGILDATSIGHAGKYTMHFREDPPPAPWKSVREQLGFSSDVTTVTVFPAEAPRQILQNLNPDPDGVLSAVAACMRNPSQHGTGKGTYYLIVLGPEHASLLAEANWSQRYCRGLLSERSRVTLDDLIEAGVRVSGDPVAGRDEKLPTAHASDILIVTAGGPGAGWSAAIPSWTVRTSARPATRPVRLTDDAPAVPSATLEDVDFL